MPSVRKFTAEEVQAQLNRGKSARKLLEERMDALFSDFAVGDYGEMVPEEGELEVTARARIKAAAQRRGMRAKFLRRKGDAKLFKVEAGAPARRGKPRP